MTGVRASTATAAVATGLSVPLIGPLTGSGVEGWDGSRVQIRPTARQ
jgi:hypothetical protein